MAYKDDLTAAHSRIHALEMENRKLTKVKIPKPPKEKKVKCTECGGWFHRIGKAVTAVVTRVVIGTVVLAVVGAGAYPLYMGTFHAVSEGCYISYDNKSNRYLLHESIAWASDRLLGEYKSMEEGLSEAELLQCPVVDRVTP